MMFRFYRRWGATPRLELDPTFRIPPRRRWVGSFRGLGGVRKRFPVAIDLAGSAGLLAGQGLVDDLDADRSIPIQIDGEEAGGEMSLLFWFDHPDFAKPLEAIGEFDATHTELSGEWCDGRGDVGMFLFRRV